MGDTRASIFDAEDLNLDEFKPSKPVRQAPAETEKAAAKAGFVSREAHKVVPITPTPPPAVAISVPAPAPAAASPRQQRRYRTGRNAQFNLRAKTETIAEFTAIADAQGWVFGEALEKAVELLRAKYGLKAR